MCEDKNIQKQLGTNFRVVNPGDKNDFSKTGTKREREPGTPCSGGGNAGFYCKEQ